MADESLERLQHAAEMFGNALYKPAMARAEAEKAGYEIRKDEREWDLKQKEEEEKEKKREQARLLNEAIKRGDIDKAISDPNVRSQLYAMAQASGDLPTIAGIVEKDQATKKEQREADKKRQILIDYAKAGEAYRTQIPKIQEDMLYEKDPKKRDELQAKVVSITEAYKQNQIKFRGTYETMAMMEGMEIAKSVNDVASKMGQTELSLFDHPFTNNLKKEGIDPTILESMNQDGDHLPTLRQLMSLGVRMWYQAEGDKKKEGIIKTIMAERKPKTLFEMTQEGSGRSEDEKKLAGYLGAIRTADNAFAKMYGQKIAPTKSLPDIVSDAFSEIDRVEAPALEELRKRVYKAEVPREMEKEKKHVMPSGRAAEQRAGAATEKAIDKMKELHRKVKILEKRKVQGVVPLTGDEEATLEKLNTELFALMKQYDISPKQLAKMGSGNAPE